MRAKIICKVVVSITAFLFLLGSAYGVDGLSGKVFTLPVNTENQPPLTTVSGMPVVFNESNEHNILSGHDGVYNLNVSGLAGSLYTLRLDDNISIGDLVAHNDVYLTSYTVPTVLNPGNTTEHDVLVFTPQQLTTLGITLTSGKGAIMVLTFEPEDEAFITGATAVIRNINGQNVGTIRYIAFDQNSPLGITLKTSPSSNSVENGGTFGFIAYNIDPGLVMISATKSGYTFMWRPAFVYADSITSGISKYDSLLGRAGSYVIESMTGYLVDENGSPVSSATVTLCGMNKSATTRTDGSFTLTNVPYPAIVMVRARKTGYKDTYSYAIISESEGDVQFSSLQEGGEGIVIIISNTFAQNLGLDFTGGGVIAGRIEDRGNNPVKNAEVYVWDEYGDTPSSTPVKYVDCMMEEINEQLNGTSDSGAFVLDSLSEEPEALGINPARPIYLKFEHENTAGNTWYLSPHCIAPVFNNGITLLTIMKMYDTYIGKINISGGQPQTWVIDSNAQGIPLLYMKLEVPEEEFEGQYATPFLKSFILNYEGNISPGQYALYKKEGENWVSVSTTISQGAYTIYFNNIINLQLPAEILVKGSFSLDDDSLTLSAPYCYFKLEKNCNMVVTADLSEIMEDGLEVYVSVDGAPVEGNKIYVKTAEPSIAVEPEELDFGKVIIGQNRTYPITVYNTSTQTVQVTSSIEGTDANQFSESLAASTFNLEVGGSKTLYITFTPTSSGQKSATLRLSYTGAGQQEDVLVPLTGEGVSSDTGGDGGGGGCFIATATFGSPLHPYVGILREFRDNILLKNKAGRSFVRWYYIHSPAAAKVIERNKTLKMFTRMALLPLIGIAWLFVKGIIPYIMLVVASSGLIKIRR